MGRGVAITGLIAWGLIASCSDNDRKPAAQRSSSTGGHDGGSVGVAPIDGDASIRDASPGDASSAHPDGPTGSGGLSTGGVSGSGAADGAVDDASPGPEKPVINLLLLVDRSMASGPIGRERFDQMKNGIALFLRRPEARRFGVALQFFPKQDDEACNASYKAPLVGVTLLPAGESTLLSALDSRSAQETAQGQPRPQSPMSTALRHSIRYAYAWVDQNPDQFVNVVLISEMEIGFDCVFTSLADFELATADVRVPLSPVKLSVISLSGDTYAAETIASMHFGNAVSALDDASDLTPQVEQALLDRSQMYFSR